MDEEMISAMLATYLAASEQTEGIRAQYKYNREKLVSAAMQYQASYPVQATRQQIERVLDQPFEQTIKQAKGEYTHD